MVTADNITDEQIRELRKEQIALWRQWADLGISNSSRPLPFPVEDLDYSFAAVCGRESIVGLFSGERISANAGREHCAAILNARQNGGRP